MLNAPIYAALLGGLMILLQAILMLSAGTYRGRNKKGAGVDGDMTLERLVRRHGNLAENAAIFIAVLAVYELLEGQTTIALSLAILFVIARIAHAIGFSNNVGSHGAEAGQGGRIFVLFRMIGAGFTALSLIILGVATVLAVIPLL